MTAKKKKSPTWTDLKARLKDFDRAGLIGLVQDLYAANKENQLFLHARFGLLDDALEPYKTVIDRWLWPDVYRNQDISIAKAKKAITDYKRAIGQPEGLAELMVFFCERSAGFSADVGVEGDAWFDALLGMFEQALKAIDALPEAGRPQFRERLEDVRHASHNFGYGVSDAMDDLFGLYGVDG